METENTILLQIQQNLEALQKQIDSMKPADTLPPLQLPASGLRDKFKEKSNELMQIMKEIAQEESVYISAAFSATGEEYCGLGEAVFFSADNIAQIDENKFSAALEAFSSPKRISILKTLMSKKFLSSNELTMKTGCIGGQLYHHLSILETAQIICKSNEMYTLTDRGRNIANEILCIVFGEPF